MFPVGWEGSVGHDVAGESKLDCPESHLRLLCFGCVEKQKAAELSIRGVIIANPAAVVHTDRLVATDSARKAP